MLKNFKGYTLLLLLFATVKLFATHNRAGEILFKHISGLTYQIKIVTYSDPSSTASLRNTIEVCWGDEPVCSESTNTTLTRDSVIGINQNYQKNVWLGTHTYNGPGSFIISIADPARNAGINNIANSVSVPLYLESLLRISPFQGFKNDSPILLNYPIDNACFNRLFVHNPGAVDPDGDSLAYEIQPSRTTGGLLADGYFFPPASNSITVDPITGDLIWDMPSQIGSYNVAIKIKEYRNEVLIGYVIRDMQIDVSPCSNNPPIIVTKDNYCVEANDFLFFNVNAFDTDPNTSENKVTLTSTGLPYSLNPNGAFFTKPSPASNVNGTFSWFTSCSHVRFRPYNVLFKATDNGNPELTAYKTSTISVIAPAPKNLMAIKDGINAQITWNESICKEAIGYKIYRRIDSSGFIPDSCLTGVPSNIGYTLIKTINPITITSYLDNNNGLGLIPGKKYCYLIIAFFADGAESYASNESCVALDKSTPITTNVSVDSTNAISGVINLKWSNPDSIDGVQYPAPYRYLIEKQINGIFVAIDSTNSLQDTSYIHTNVNTTAGNNIYRVTLLSLGNARVEVGKSYPASQLLLSTASADQIINLSWNASVPWDNFEYIIYRKNLTSNLFDSIGTTMQTNYADSFLSNNQEYCYFVQSLGKYNPSIFVDTLYNLSQISCAIPKDDIAPCSLSISENYDCLIGTLDLNWQLKNCLDNSDIELFKIYRKDSINGIVLIQQINNSNQRSFNFTIDISKASLAGCYVITAVDSIGNESELSNEICIETCPEYKLPNVITPNGDGQNDLFRPFPYRYVERIELSIYDRWGVLVFKTEDPDINWDGTHDFSGELVTEGVYFYVCNVYEIRLEGITVKNLKGNITVLDATVKGFKD